MTNKNNGNNIKEVFGSLKDWNIDSQRFKDEQREECELDDAKMIK